MVQEANNIKNYSELYTLGLSHANEFIIFMKRVNFEDDHSKEKQIGNYKSLPMFIIVIWKQLLFENR